MLELKNELKLTELSMGMSSDYLNAIDFGSTLFKDRFRNIWSKILIYFDLFFFIILSRIKKSFFDIAIHPAVGLKFFVKCKKIALPLGIFELKKLYLISIK